MTSSSAMSATARGRETPDAGALLGKEGGINPSLALHSNCPGEPQRAWPQAEQCRGTGGWNRHFPWLQPGTEVAQGPTTLQDPSTAGPPHQQDAAPEKQDPSMGLGAEWGQFSPERQSQHMPRAQPRAAGPCWPRPSALPPASHARPPAPRPGSPLPSALSTIVPGPSPAVPELPGR